MKKGKALLFTLLSFVMMVQVVEAAYAQQRGMLTASVVDAENNEAVLGAVVELIPLKTPDQKKYTTSGYQGKFSMDNLTYGEYTLTISFLGNAPLVKSVQVNKSTVSLGVLKMEQDAKNIDAVVLEVPSLRTSQKGDTLVYNADAFKVLKDADTEDILQKMPGITVKDGVVEAKGETVQKILVDGKEFFGSDVTSAMKNLPAEAVDKIEVFNKLSDNAEATGVDDGESYMAINIVTRPGMSNGVFGKFAAGYGYDDKYNIGASVNYFAGNRRISATVMTNNLNIRNFSTDDILGAVSGGGGMSGNGGGSRGHGGSGNSNFMVGSQSGISTVKSVALNYVDVLSKTLNMSADYSFSDIRNYTHTITDRQYYPGEDGSTQLYNSSATRNSNNLSHRFGAKLDYKPNANNTFMFRPRLTLQYNKPTSGSESETSLLQEDLAKAMLNLFKSTSRSDLSGYSAGGALIYTHKFKKLGRSLTADFNGNVSNNESDRFDYSLTQYFMPPQDSVLNQQLVTDSKSYSLSGRVTYAEPLSRTSQLLGEYSARYSYSDSDRRSYLYNDLLDGYTDFEPNLSNTYNSGYLTQSVGPGYRLNNDKAMLMGNIFYQHSSLVGDQQFPVIANPKLSNTFENVTYRAMFNYKFTPNNTLRTFLRSSTNNPSVSQLQDVLDISDPLFISQGNSKLRPVYSNQLMVNFVNANVSKGQTFMVVFGGTLQQNYIANSTQIADRNGYEVKDDQGNTIATLNRGAQYSKPINMDGYRNMMGMVSFGTPVKWLMSNVNFRGRVMYNTTPGIYNLQKNMTDTYTYTLGIVIGSNINEKIDFTLSYDGGYNVATNSLRKESNNTYLNQVATGKIKWVMWGGFTFQANASYSYYRGVTDKFTEEFLLCNASLGKKLFKNQRGEINVGVNDLFNQNKSFTRNISDTYIENVTKNVIGRYVSLTFTYNLRSFKGAQPSDSQLRKAMGGDVSRGPSGPPSGLHD